MFSIFHIFFSVEKLKESPEVQEKIIQSSYEERYVDLGMFFLLPSSKHMLLVFKRIAL